ncbi:hypothetical protein J6590_046612 [Homalodisca vitripennis]|nr:hypothetical protein J6590_046612 [Homalodisca vitripennis]
MSEPKKLSRWYFGGLASAGAACCTHPLDLLKPLQFFFFFYGAAYCHARLKSLLRTPEAHHEAYQSMISAVPQTAENNLSGPPREIHHDCPNYQRTIKEQVFGSFILLITHSTEGCRLCEDASSSDHVPWIKPITQEDIDLLSKRRSGATLEEADCNTILLILMPGCNLNLILEPRLDRASALSFFSFETVF